MTHPHFHAESSVKLFGGIVADYLPVSLDFQRSVSGRAVLHLRRNACHHRFSDNPGPDRRAPEVPGHLRLHHP